MAIKITESNLKKIISDSIKSIMESSGELLGSVNFGNEANLINAGKLQVIAPGDDSYNTYKEPVWNILSLSYEGIGGLKSYRDFKDFSRKKHIFKVVENANGDIIAAATYRRIEESLKMTAIGCNQQEDEKQALQQIIQDDIIHLELHYWVEASDAIEHYFKKYNGYPIPNILASKILSVPHDSITLLNDNVHYKRAIGIDKVEYTKMIFGFKSKEIFEDVINSVENYSDFMRNVNSLNESTDDYNALIKRSVYIIENIYRLHEEDGFNELIPSWKKALDTSYSILINAPQKTTVVVQYIEYAEYLLTDMDVLTLHSFKF